jgi:hypothetical protein
MSCPQCKSDKFYIKDPEDDYETYEFETGSNGFQFSDPENAPDLTDAQKVFCSCCAWHGRLADLK